MLLKTLGARIVTPEPPPPHPPTHTPRVVLRRRPLLRAPAPAPAPFILTSYQYRCFRELSRFLSKNSDTTLSSTMKRRLRADLFQATKDGDFDQCQKLIEDGADVNRKDDDGATCLIFAAMRGWLAISELLVDNSAEVDVQDAKSGWTALMQATYYGHKSIARLLIDSGADISLQASNSCTAFDIASIIGDTEVVRLLAQASMRIGPPPKASKKMFNPTASPAPRTASPLKPTAKSSPRSSPQMKKKVLSHQPGSLLSLRAREADGTLRADRGPSTLAALAGAGADLGEDTLRSDMHSFGGTMGSMGMSTTSTMGSTSSAGETGAALRLAKSNSLENERKSKKNGKEASKRKGSSLRPFRSQNKVSPGKPSRVSSSGRPGSAEKKDGKKKSWWRRTAARFAKFLRRSARVEVSPTGPASDDARQEQQQQQQQQQHQQQHQQQQQVGGPRRPSGTSLTAWGTSKSPTTSQVSSAGSADGAPAQFKVDTLPKRNKGKGKASAMAAKPMVVPRYDQPGQRPQQRASTTSIGSVTRPKTAAGEQADNLRVKSPARNQAPAPPPWRKNGSLMSQDPMNLSILSAAQNGEIAHGGPGKRPSLNMGAPMSTLPANIMAPIKPPFMPPPAFELHHIERPKFERPSSRAALPDSSSSGGGGGEPVRRSSKPFVRPSIHGHGARNTVDKKTWSLPRKSVDAGGGASGKFGPPKKRKSGPRVSFLSPTPVEEQKTRAGSTSSTGSGAATEAHTASGGSAGSSLNNSGAGASARKREAATLKDVLQRHKLMEHFSLFDEQDIDLEAFLTMTDEDMVELGLKDAGSRAKLCAVIVKIRGSKQGQGISRVDSAVTQFRNANAERRRSSMSMPPKRAGSTSSIGSNAPMPLPPKQQSRPPQGRLPPPASGGGRLPQVREAAGGKKPPLN